MKIQTHQPHPSIAGYVSDILVMESDRTFGETVLPLIARGHPSITFRYTDLDLIFKNERDSGNLVLYGQNTEPLDFPIAGQVLMIAYFLYPYALKPLFGFDAKEVTDACIDLNLTGEARQLSLKEQLLNASSLGERLQLINGYVVRLAQKDKKGINNTIAFAVKQIQENKTTLPVLQQELFVTERTLQRLFEQHIGLSPKMYSRVCRFQDAFQQLGSNHFTEMAAVAYDNGYADQSHLIRTFKAFTRYTPLEYLQQATAFPG